jgi:hypothetical protein
MCLHLPDKEYRNTPENGYSGPDKRQLRFHTVEENTLRDKKTYKNILPGKTSYKRFDCALRLCFIQSYLLFSYYNPT